VSGGLSTVTGDDDTLRKEEEDDDDESENIRAVDDCREQASACVIARAEFC